MKPGLIPPLDAAPLPGPVWLFQVLLVLTFFLHLVFMNLTLGGTLMAAISRLLSGGREGDHRTVLTSRLMRVNSYGIALTITTGIAPLLFIQVLYQQYFYTATILLGWIWFAFLVMLVVGYYAAYVFKLRFDRAPGKSTLGTLWLFLSALLFLLIAAVHVAVNLIHAQPGKWAAIETSPWSILGDPAYFPRLLHFVLAGFAFSGVVMAWWAVRRAAAGHEVELNGKLARSAWRWALWATVAQIVDGVVLLLVLPRHVLLGLMRGGAATMVPLTLAILLAIGLLMMLSRVTDPVRQRGTVTGTLAALALTIAVMAITRDQVRDLYLAAARAKFELMTAPQWGTFALFAVLLVAGLATVAYLVKRVLSSPATGSEAA
ncbi:MAG: hypothetical protein LJE95_08495 [Acidobacteria bacterium]|jgi:hypothetical protein|nr:hypothetical protein [Acidobacteriota bacterium]